LHNWLLAFGSELAPENSVDAAEEQERATDENRGGVVEDGDVDTDGFETKVGAREVKSWAWDSP